MTNNLPMTHGFDVRKRNLHNQLYIAYCGRLWLEDPAAGHHFCAYWKERVTCDDCLVAYPADEPKPGIVIENNKLRFSTGKEIYCYGNIVGLNLDVGTETGLIFYGHDGSISTIVDHDFEPTIASGKELTVYECHELSEYMIAAWTGFKNNLPKTT